MTRFRIISDPAVLHLARRVAALATGKHFDVCCTKLATGTVRLHRRKRKVSVVVVVNFAE